MSYLLTILMIVIGIVAVGLRIFPYTIDRSLWLDEAALANNLLLPNTILNNMTYGQASPPLFKLISLININILGINEIALRFFPLVCGIISIPIFYLIIRKVLNSRLAKIIAFILFATNNYLIYYSSEFKQYNSDMIVVLSLICFLIYYPIEKLNNKKLLAFGLIYSIIIWLSHFSLFLFPILILYFLYKKINIKSQVFFATPFIISFILYYVLHLQFVSHSEFMNNYWEFSFLTSLQAWTNGLNNFITSVFFPCLMTLPILILIIYGAFINFKENKGYGILLTMPILCVLSASTLALYPFLPRLCLPLIPLCIIFICKTFDTKKELKTTQILSLILFICSFWTYITQYPFIILKKNIYYREEIKPLLSIIKENIKDDDKIYFMQDTHQAYRFYNRIFNFDKNKVLIAPYNENFESHYTKPIERMTDKNTRYWVVFLQNAGHKKYTILNEWLEKNTEIIKVYSFYENYLFYVERK